MLETNPHLDVDVVSKLFSGLVPGLANDAYEKVQITALDIAESVATVSRDLPVDDSILQAAPPIEPDFDSAPDDSTDSYASFHVAVIKQLKKQSQSLQVLVDYDSKLNRKKRENDFFLRLRSTLLPLNRELTSIKDAIGQISSVGADSGSGSGVDTDTDSEKKKRRQGRNRRRNIRFDRRSGNQHDQSRRSDRDRDRESNRDVDQDRRSDRDRDRESNRDVDQDRRSARDQDQYSDRADSRSNESRNTRNRDVDQDSESDRRSRRTPVPDVQILTPTPNPDLDGRNSTLRNVLSSVPKIGAITTAAMVLPSVIDTAQVLMSDTATTEEKITSARETTVDTATIAAGAGLGGTIGGSIGAGLGLLFGGVGAVPLGIAGNAIGSAIGGWLASESGIGDYINENVGTVLDSTVSTVVDGAGKVIQSVSTGADDLIENVSTTVGPAWESVKSGIGSFASFFVSNAKADDAYTGPVITKADLTKQASETEVKPESTEVEQQVTADAGFSEAKAVDPITQSPVTLVPALTRISPDNFVERFSAANQAQDLAENGPLLQDPKSDLFALDKVFDKPFSPGPSSSGVTSDSGPNPDPKVLGSTNTIDTTISGQSAIASIQPAVEVSAPIVNEQQSYSEPPQVDDKVQNQVSVPVSVVSVPVSVAPSPASQPPLVAQTYSEKKKAWLLKEQEARDQLHVEMADPYADFNESTFVDSVADQPQPVTISSEKPVEVLIKREVQAQASVATGPVQVPTVTAVLSLARVPDQVQVQAPEPLASNPIAELDPEIVKQDITNETTNPLFKSANPIVKQTTPSSQITPVALSAAATLGISSLVAPNLVQATPFQEVPDSAPLESQVLTYSEQLTPALVNEKKKAERVLNEFYPQDHKVELAPDYNPLEFKAVPQHVDQDTELFIRRIEDSTQPIKDAIISSINVEQQPSDFDKPVKAEQQNSDNYPRLAFDQASGSDISRLSESFHESITETSSNNPSPAQAPASGGDMLGISSSSLGFKPAPITFETTPLMVNDLGLLLINSGII